MFYLLGRWQEKNVTSTVKVFKKRSITLKNAWLPPHFMLWNGSGKPIQYVISFWLWAKGIWTVFWLNQRKAVRDAKSAVATILLILKTYQKWILCYHLPCSFKIFINVFAFLFVKENSKKICEEISFPSFFRKSWCRHFCWDSRLIISEKCVVIPIFLCGFQWPLQRSTFSACS